MPLYQEFNNPRLAAVYDSLGPRQDMEFYCRPAAGLGARTIADVGCGTGELACELARRGHQVTGVDPAGPMLAVARARADGDRVRWIEGDASRLDAASADLVLMTAHVPQVIWDDETWRRTLSAIRTALRPGGRVAFESRNPQARAWERWNAVDSLHHATDPVAGRFDWWSEVVEVADEGRFVRTRVHYRFPATAEELISDNLLRFPARTELEHDLTVAGFTVERVHGDWTGAPLGPASPEMIFVAIAEPVLGWIREIVLDCPDPWALARFWAGLLGGTPVEWYPGWVTLEPAPSPTPWLSQPWAPAGCCRIGLAGLACPRAGRLGF